MYISGDNPATCFQVMPLLLAGISSKTGREAVSSGESSERSSSIDFALALPSAEGNGPFSIIACAGPKGVGASVLVTPESPSSCSQRRREIIAAWRRWHWEAPWRRPLAEVAFHAR